MSTLGTWPQDIYYLSWMTQRLANRAPEWTKARMWSWSTLQQMLNPIGADLERVHKQLVEERNNIFLSSTDINLIDRLYSVELGVGMEFTNNGEHDGIPVFEQPTVYADISDVEYQLTIAANNDIESLSYTTIPSRLTDGSESYEYVEVIPRTDIQDLSSTTPNDIVINGHLYITIRDNSTWELRARNNIYYSKVYIRGITRKGTEVEEAVPIRFNGTFKTINQWQSVTQVFVSYMDDTAQITVESFPYDRTSQLDTYNLVIPNTSLESWRFLRFGSKVWGSTLVSEGFTTNNFDVIRQGYDDLDYEYEIELHDADSLPLTLTAMTLKPNTNYMFAIDSTNLYIYNTRLPYPDLTVLESDHPDTKMSLYSDRWIYSRDDIVSIKTDIKDVSVVPWKLRWGIKDPDGQEYYLDIDGTKVATTVNAWIDNDNWESGIWSEVIMELLIQQTGTHQVTLECLYSDDRAPDREYTLTTRFIFYVPVAIPETVIPLPAALQSSSDLSFDSDGKLWFLSGSDVLLGNVYYDYYLVDYDRNKIWLRENYSSVRVVI